MSASLVGSEMCIRDSYLSKNGQPEALVTYEKNKRRFFWQVYKKDPSLAKFKASTKHTLDNVQRNKVESGWMNKFKIAELNGILPGVPEYDALCEALVSDLQSQPASNKKLSDIGMKEYFYIHNHSQENEGTQTKKTELQQDV
eukprot:11534251-Alexandrium_andersonii.AAC.1